MRAPFQDGDFPGPVKYGYLNVGVVEHGPAGAARTHRLLPLPAPDRVRRAGPVGGRRARRRAAGARGAGRHGRDRGQRAVGRRAAARRPGRRRGRRHGRLLRRAAARPVPRRVRDAGRRRSRPGRRRRGARRRLRPAADAAPGCDLVVHTSATSAGLQRSLDLLAPEGIGHRTELVRRRRGHACHSAAPSTPGGSASGRARSAPSHPRGGRPGRTPIG